MVHMLFRGIRLDLRRIRLFFAYIWFQPEKTHSQRNPAALGSQYL